MCLRPRASLGAHRGSDRALRRAGHHLTPHVRHAAFRALIWLVAVLIPVFVGISRVYRGMHHATDVFGSVILGTLALGFAWLIVACVASVWRDRQLAFPEARLAEIDRTPAEATS